MIVRTRDGGTAEVQRSFAGFSGTGAIPQPSEVNGNYSVAGKRVTPQKAYGLPPVLRGIRLYSETIGSLPIIVYRGDPANPDTRTVVADAPQYQLLARKPNGLQTPFDFKAYIISSILGFGNAFILKAKSRGAVQELWPIDPERVTPEPEGTSIKYKVRVNPGRAVDMTRADILHIPGVLLSDPFVGVSPLMVAANAIGTSLGAEEFAGRFFDRDATPSGIITVPGSPGTQVVKDTKELWDNGGAGSRRAHTTRVLYGGMGYQQIGVDAQAAQIIETQRWTVDQAANALSLPSWALGGTDQNPRSTPEQRNMELLQFSLAPKFVSIEQALHMDDDLFPDKELAPSFLADGMLRADTLARFQAYVQGRQAGWLSANDVRIKENLPPIEGGDVYQVTPVGGAPNLQPGGAAPPPTAGELEPAVPVT